MKISGLTLGYRALANGYPIVECTRCLLSFCDEVVANIGASDDGTREALMGLGDPRIRLIEEPWDLSLREKGRLLSRETNRGMDKCSGDWIVYLQADEIMHEDDVPLLVSQMKKYSNHPRIDGLSFRYLHFYGSPHYVQDNPLQWYTRAVRAVRNNRGLVSVGDALKFRRIVDGKARRVREVRSPVRVFHYGWARSPEIMLEKQKHLERFWHDDKALADKYAAMNAETIYSDTAHLVQFTGTHPAVMREGVAAAKWLFNPKLDLRSRLVRLGLELLSRPFRKLVKRVWRKGT